MRFQHPRIRPLEIWDLQVGEQTLWEGMEDPRFGVMLARALEDLRRGTASSRSDGRLPAVPFEALHFTGGRLKNPEHTADWTFPWLHSLDAEPVYPAVAQHFMDPVIMDVGQTAIKLYRGSAQTLNVPRDWSRFPMASADDPIALEQRRAELTNWLAESLHRTGDFDSLLLALPCEITADGTLGGSSYPGMKDHPELVPAIASEFNVADEKMLLLNDAELAATELLLRTDPSLATLVLTLGFGVGAALILPRP